MFSRGPATTQRAQPNADVRQYCTKEASIFDDRLSMHTGYPETMNIPSKNVDIRHQSQDMDFLHTDKMKYRNSLLSQEDT